MKPIALLVLLLALSVLGYWYLGGTGDESGGEGSAETLGAGSGGSTVTTSDESSAPEVDVPQPSSPRRIDYRCTLAGHMVLGGSPATGWVFRVGGDSQEGTAGEFEWSFNKPQPVSWAANELGGGHARSRFARDLVLRPGPNSLDIDLEVGTLELVGFPLPAEFDLAGTADISLDLALTWENLDGLRWMATLFTAEEGSLVLENVPAGKVQLRRMLPGDRVKTLAEARVILEIDVPAGERTLLRFPD